MTQQQDVLATFTSHRGRLVRVANEIVGNMASAEDVVQDAWLRISRAARSQQIDFPVSYLYRIVRNLAIDRRRKYGFEAKIIDQGMIDTDGVMDDLPSPEAATIAKDEFRLLMQALDELPEQTRIALEMRRFEGRKLKEIAARLGISVTAAHTIIADGLAHCHRRLRLKK